jgi:protein SSD1
MLPPKIASEVCSLLPGKDRLTVSVIFKVNAHTGAVSDEETWIGKSIIKSSGKLTYKEVDAVLSGNLDTKLDGADFKQIQILHVSTHLTYLCHSMLTGSRP